jgi:hypothetical protein
MIAPRLLQLLAETRAVSALWGLPFRVDEPDVSLTDFGLALETATFAALVLRLSTRWNRLRRWSVAFFGAATVASLAGGLDHGFFRRDGSDLRHDVLWTTSLLAIGASALAMVGIGASLGRPYLPTGRLLGLVTAAFVTHAAVVLFVRHDFLIAILAYAPAALFLLGALIARYAVERDRASLLGIAAVLLAFVAAAIQRLEIGVDQIDLSHNALYHVVQAISFALLFAALRDLLGEQAPDLNTRKGVS